MRILISGSSGLVGSALCPALSDAGHDVVRLVRPGSTAPTASIPWDPSRGSVDESALEGTDAVVHLAGENIATGRWTPARKERIRSSRVDGTRALSEALARMKRPPGAMICASAIGLYGDRGDELLRETSVPGSSFLARVCVDWEAAAGAAVQAGIRVAALRFGVILTPRGGALGRMLPPFRLGLGGRVGDGGQYMSWISLDDAVGVIVHALDREGLRGPVNAVAPGPVTNLEFTRTLGRVLSRPTIFPMPAVAARLAFGEMADELLLASTRVEPARLLATGFRFLHPELDGALRDLLGR